MGAEPEGKAEAVETYELEDWWLAAREPRGSEQVEGTGVPQ